MERFKKIVSSNWQAKLIALLVSIILWFVITAFQSSVTSFPGTLPVNFKNLKSGLVTISDQDSVSIKLSVENVSLNSITADNFEASADLSNLDVGTYKKQVNVTSKNPNVNIVNVNPNELTIRIEKNTSKSVPVRVRFDGSPADGYGVSQTNVTPSEVTVSGAESVIRNITEAVLPIKLNGENSDFIKNAQPLVYTASGQEIKGVVIEPNVVSVNVSLARSGETKTVGINVKTTGELSPGFWISSISTNPDVVIIGGSSSKISQIKFVETEPIDISNLKDNKTISAKLVVLPGITIEGQVNSAKVTIEVSPSDSIKQISLTPNFTDLTSGLSVSDFTPTNILATFSAPPNVLNQIQSNIISLNLSLKSYQPGNYDVDLKPENLILPPNISFISFNPIKINITIAVK